MSRNAWIDHLRTVLTALVILHHAAIVYGGGGSWYWRQEPEASSALLLMFNAVNQSYFMGFFFLLAGYYTPPSFDRKGPKRFIAERGLRLGIPLAIYFFVLSPFTNALARTARGHPFWSGWWWVTSHRFFEPGPLWFAEALLFFALGYLAWRAGGFREIPKVARLPRPAVLLGAAVAIGLISFLVRLAVPTGRTIFALQLGYFPPYILLFIAGCLAAPHRLLERVTWPEAKPWAVLSGVLFCLWPIVYGTRRGHGSFGGGWNGNAVFYALWDPLIAVGIILTLLWAFRTAEATENRLTAWLARGAYGAYIVHPPIVVALSLLAREWGAPPLAKFAVVGIAAVGTSFVAAGAMRRIPGAERIL